MLTDKGGGHLIVSWDETLKRLDILYKTVAELMTLKHMYHLLSDHYANKRQLNLHKNESFVWLPTGYSDASLQRKCVAVYTFEHMQTKNGVTECK